MSKARAITKYAVAGSSTFLFGLAVWKAFKEPDLENPHSPQRVAIAAAALTATIWTTALL